MGRPSVLPPVEQGAPHLLADWDPANTRTPDQVSIGAGYRALWRCSAVITLSGGRSRACGHEWTTMVANRARAGTGCPACAGKAAADWNNLAATHPQIAADWHPDNPMPATDVPHGSAFRARWRCATCQHEWAKPVEKRTMSDYGCPACGRHVPTADDNLAITHPHLLAQWHPDNAALPTAYRTFSNQPVRWRCLSEVNTDEGARPCGHVWTAPISSRAGGRGCPACRGLATADWNTLAAQYPDLAAEWHPDNERTPDSVTPGSHFRALWKCQQTVTAGGTSWVCGHEWTATVTNRSKGRGCPACMPVNSSRDEVHLACEIAIFLPVDMSPRRVYAGGRAWSLDVTVPDMMLAVEYDGAYWHAGKEQVDARKTDALSDAGWTVIRAREHPLLMLCANDVAVTSGRHKENAVRVLRKIESVLQIELAGLDGYEVRRGLGNAAAAQERLGSRARRPMGASGPVGFRRAAVPEQRFPATTPAG
jgi:hypothetical protein